MPTTLKENTIQIIELEEGWQIAWTPTGPSPTTFETAAEALAVVKDRDRVFAAAGFNIVTTIEWRPRTKVGRAIINALAYTP